MDEIKRGARGLTGATARLGLGAGVLVKIGSTNNFRVVGWHLVLASHEHHDPTIFIDEAKTA